MKQAANIVVNDVAVIGIGCKLPGADGVDGLWANLLAGRNHVRAAPRGRWSVERFLRPGQAEPGFTYTFAGGYLDTPFAFDPGPFGISPREAGQMDPQQRLLLETTWRAFEDAGIPPGSLAGANVGVYVGGSTVDYQSGASHDPSAMESHFMTGNSLSILSNRISYVFDFRGPSFTVDSACSSSFVALVEAMNALREGRVDLAVVAGVNMLLSPAPFIGFSQARMLSPTGLSRPFSQDADGYVRAEGAVTIVLRRLDEARANRDRIRSVIAGAAVNSDGRTNGISLPSLNGQMLLMQKLYEETGVDPEQLAFVEAHGTGTKVGDPIEATAIGTSLGRHRTRPLPIGSIKSNIGHLEAASGLAGLVKATLAMQHGLLPRSLFAETLNENIDFDSLNLTLARAPVTLPKQSRPLMAGICNYGFGGTNAHVILSAGESIASPAPRLYPAGGLAVRTPRRQASVLLVSAASQQGLVARVDQVAGLLEAGGDAGDIASGLGHFHETMPFRLATPIISGRPIAPVLRAFCAGEGDTSVAFNGSFAGREAKVAFVYSGNGCQFREMGAAAYAGNARFREEIDAIDALFKPRAGWSLAEAITSGLTSEQLSLTSVSQPIIFAIQSALGAVLGDFGVRPGAVIGHSVGEVAAAEISGALTRADCVLLIHERSKHQEVVRGRGFMLVVAASEESVRKTLETFGDPAIEIAAVNSASSTTVVGPTENLSAFQSWCRKNRIAAVNINVDYPFHSSALDEVRDAVRDGLASLAPRKGQATFYSTVAGEILGGDRLGATYWWNNIRRPVQFEAGLAACARDGYTHFIEIGPRSILVSTMMETIRSRGADAIALPTFSNADSGDFDPVLATLSRLVANGAPFSATAVFGAKPQSAIALPGYPFQQSDYSLPESSEALLTYGRMVGAKPRHPLLGERMADGSPEWRSLIDPAIVPCLDDHRVDGSVVVPAAGLVEMSLAAARDLFGPKPVELDEFDILKALVIPAGELRETSTRWSHQTGGLEIWSRKRFSGDEWVLHARGLLRDLKGKPGPILAPPPVEKSRPYTREEVYEEALRAGLQYGPTFRLVSGMVGDFWICDAQIDAPPAGAFGAFEDIHVLNPISVDAAFHGLFIMRPQRDGEMKAHLPIRIRKLRVWEPGGVIRRAVAHLTRETDRSKTVALSFVSGDGKLIASAEAAVLRSVYLSRATVDDRTFHSAPLALPGKAPLAPPPAHDAANADVPAAWLVLRAFGVSLAHEVVSRLAAECPTRAVDDLVASNVVAEPASVYLESVLRLLAEFGALEANGKGSHVRASISLPPPAALLSTLMERFPEANLEIRLAAQALENMETVLRTGNFLARSQAMAHRCETTSLLATAAPAALATAISGLGAGKPRLLVVEPFSRGLTRALPDLLKTGSVAATFAAASDESLDEARQEFGAGTDVDFLVLDGETLGGAPRFDALVCLASGEPPEAPTLVDALRLLTPGAPVLAACPGSDATLETLCGLWRDWLDPSPAGFAGREPLGDRLASRLREAGVSDVATAVLSDRMSRLVTGRAPAGAVPARASGVAAIGSVPGLAGAKQVSASDPEALLAWIDAVPAEETPTIVVAPPAASADHGERLAGQVELLKALLGTVAAASRTACVVVVTRGAQAGEPDAVEAGVWGFTRVAINEFPTVDLRIIDLAPGAPDDAIATVLASGGDEREWLAGPEGVRVNRVRRGMQTDRALGPDEASRLHFDHSGRLEHFTWRIEKRRAPAADEVEVEIVAVGLNFRDVLVGLGVLDDDLLGAGLTQAALGFECSGRVTRVGAGVTHLQPGDAVMGFAAGTFASHVVAPAWHFFRAPASIPVEAAATIPVAFATAWYSLVNRAGIRAGDDVLIHGAAGGVGLAAIQIARRFGARVIGTASDPTRRAIAKAAGAQLLFDSRHERFADDIAKTLGGVDVVLNSLAGSAMQASFALLKPFGRFIELGKRDYLDNTHLGLRPFVRNIAYSGVDLDELLAHDRPAVEAIMATLADLFDKGELRPLPYQVHEAHETGLAFRSMQSSEHVGKIVVRPSRAARADIERLEFRAGEGVCLIVGGAGGFGFETARYLARKGAKTLVLASRRGEVEPDLVAHVEAMRASGVKVVVKALDVRDARAVDALVKEIVAGHGPIRGIVHAAVQMDDGMIPALTPERLRSVLGAKVDGVVNLDAATAGQPLDYFVVYSSATTVIGSPGQAAYVAANGFLEGWARRRRALGKPALAIGWGAISDAGIIARDKQLGERLRRTTGVVGIRSFEALAHLGRLLVLGDRVDPVQFYTNITPGGAADKLALLKSPAFSGLFHGAGADHEESGGDLAALIAGKSKAEALVVITQALRREVSQILRMPEAEVDPTRPLGELGLDSLMGLELHLGIERLSGIQFPMMGASERRLTEVAASLHDHLSQAQDPEADIEDQRVKAMAATHSASGISVEDAHKFQKKLQEAAAGLAQ